MEIRTYTSLWQIERRLYRIDDLVLPGAPTYRQIAIFIGFTVPWIFLMGLLNVPFSSPWQTVWIVPPIAITYFANKPIAESKTGIQIVTSNIRFIMQSKTYTGLKSFTGKSLIYVKGVVWSRN